MIIEAIDKYLQERPKKYRPIRCFHPSSLHKAESYLFKHYLEGDGGKEFDSRIIRIFDNGHATHDRLQGYLKEIGILLEAEVPLVDEDYEIQGHCDGIVEINGMKGVLEIKSINLNGFYALHEPKAEHILQLNIYMHCLNIPRGVLLYENKNNQELKEFFVKQDTGIVNEVLNKIRNVQNRIRTLGSGSINPEGEGKILQSGGLGVGN